MPTLRLSRSGQDDGHPVRVRLGKEPDVLNTRTKNRLLRSGDWMIRMDDDGLSYAGFQWAAIGKWTTAPDWDASPECGRGLHGQNAKANGYCQAGTRLVLVETAGEQVVIDDNKCKVRRAKIVAVNSDIPSEFVACCALDLSKCTAPLPQLTQIGGYADLRYYAHELPQLTQIGGHAYLRGYTHKKTLQTRLGIK